MLDPEGSKIKRANNRESSAALLREAGIEFESKNDGAHLIVRHGDLCFDFWPGTGLFNERGKPGYRRGVFKLLHRIRQYAKTTTELEPFDPSKCGCNHPPFNPPCTYCESGEYLP